MWNSSNPSSSWAGISITALPSYLGAVAPTVSALFFAYTCCENLPGRPAALSHPQLLCSVLMGCKPFPALTYSCDKSHPIRRCWVRARLHGSSLGISLCSHQLNSPLHAIPGCCLMYCKNRNVRGLAQQDCLSTRSGALPPLQELFP